MRQLRIENLEICENEKSRHLTDDDLDLLEKMNQEWEQKNNRRPSSS